MKPLRDVHLCVIIRARGRDAGGGGERNAEAITRAEGRPRHGPGCPTHRRRIPRVVTLPCCETRQFFFPPTPPPCLHPRSRPPQNHKLPTAFRRRIKLLIQQRKREEGRRRSSRPAELSKGKQESPTRGGRDQDSKRRMSV